MSSEDDRDRERFIYIGKVYTSIKNKKFLTFPSFI